MSKNNHSHLDLNSSKDESNCEISPSRRKFLGQLTTLAVAAPVFSSIKINTKAKELFPNKQIKRPNILIFHSDQFRWDFVCAAGLNPMSDTPNLDTIYRRGTVFQNFITNQPLCAPSRSCLWTGQYATTTGVWRNRLGLPTNANTIAAELSKAGYTANYIGKWHLAPKSIVKHGGAVPAIYRGGFNDVWYASNAPELSSHPYHGTFWDRDGNPLNYKGVYRVDFLTDLTEKFLRQKHDKPFLLVLSQLEPHQQNDIHGFAPPKGYSKKFRNPYAPPDVRPFPGDWPYQLANYYGDVKAIDESIGRIFKTLREQKLEDDTIIIFLSDHGCHFRTRNSGYKRSPHESSIHVPLIITGPGFNNSQTINELVSMIDVTPSILDFLGLPIPSSMQGKSFIPLLNDPEARKTWRNEVFIQISESETARALRTPEWTYVAISPESNLINDSASLHYRDYQLYNNKADATQLVNQAGRSDSPELVHYTGNRSIREITDHLRERLAECIVEAGENKPQIDRWKYYP